ncbi:hypothetical protein [uncultured Roseovarius sp.]|uniref:hypothetical protein n=1 Tax=uncultured Roseovarius sp. TaxID=293344 RepID=UPI0025CF01E4|nr:hypothetical protein [uncultured Roseovarius sp.]
MSMVFDVTFRGKSPVALETRRANLHLALRTEGLTVGVDILATRPGMTTDDRGAPGWDAPVGLDLSVPGVALPDVETGLREREIAFAGVPELDQGFFHYWDHESHARLRAVLRCDATGRYTVAAEGESESGHRFRLDQAVKLVAATARDDVDAGSARVRACFEPGAELTLADMPNGGVIAKPAQATA